MADDRAIRIPVDIDDKAAQKELQALTRQITSMEGKINQKTAKRNAIAEQLQTARQEAVQAYTEVERLQKALDASRAKTSGRDATGNPTQFVQELERQKQITAELSTQEKILHQKEAAAMRLEQQDARMVAEIDAQNTAMQETEQKAAAVNGQLQRQATKHWPQIRDRAREALQGANGGFNRGLKSLLRYGFGIRSVFMLFRRLRTATIEGVKAFAAYDSETQASINNLKTALGQLKGAWAAAVAPIFNAVAPAIEWFINLITSAANAVATFFAVVQGKSSYKKAVYNLDAVGEAASGAASDVEDLKNQFSGLDEINAWNADNAGGGGGGSGSSGGGLSYVDQAIDMNSRAAKIGDFVRENLESVQLLVDIFGFAIGVILLCSGNILLGLGFMLFFGYRGIKNATANWDAIRQQLEGPLGEVVGIVSLAILTIGVVLLFTGHIPLGIGMIIAGATGAYAAVSANWNSLKGYLDGPVGDILEVAGKVAMVLGIILMFLPGTLAIGLGLLALGAAAEYAGSGGSLSSPTEMVGGLVKNILAIENILLAAGIIAMMFGNIPLGLGLLVMAGVKAVSGDGKPQLSAGTVEEKMLDKMFEDTRPGEDFNDWYLRHGELEDLHSNAKELQELREFYEEYMADPTGTWQRHKGEFGNASAYAADPALAQALAEQEKQQKQLVKDAEFARLAKATEKATAEIQRATERTSRGGIETTADIKVGVKKGQWNEDAFEAATLSSGSINKTVNTTAKKGVGWDKEAYEVTTGKTNQNVSLAIGLSKLGWTTLSDFVNQSTGAQVKKGVGVTKDGWSTVAAFVGASTGGAVAKAVGLSKTGWTTLQNYATANSGGSVSKAVGLYRDGWTTVSGWVNNYIGSGLRVGVTLGATAVTRYAASGGYITNGQLESWSVPQYAGGTTRAHGTMFVAGEAGPEVVGHINGRTEILNRSQLASVMYAAVVSGMARVLAPAVTVLDRIADLLAGPQLATAGSAVAAGVVVPPQFTRGGSDRLGQIADMLDRLESRLGGGAGGGSYQFTAKLNQRTIFDAVITEAQLRQAQTGRNPFNF